jgi:hypothetical protein
MKVTRKPRKKLIVLFGVWPSPKLKLSNAKQKLCHGVLVFGEVERETMDVSVADTEENCETSCLGRPCEYEANHD